MQKLMHGQLHNGVNDHCHGVKIFHPWICRIEHFVSVSKLQPSGIPDLMCVSDYIAEMQQAADGVSKQAVMRAAAEARKEKASPLVSEALTATPDSERATVPEVTVITASGICECAIGSSDAPQ